MLSKFRDLLPKKLAKHNLTKPVLAAQVVDAWADIAATIVAKAQNNSQALTFKQDNVLTVRCKHAALANELTLHEQDLIAAYGKKFPQLKLKLRFQTGELVDPEARMPG